MSPDRFVDFEREIRKIKNQYILEIPLQVQYS